MITREHVLQLADLARLSITDKQCDSYLKNFQSILAYIDTLNTVTPDTRNSRYMLTNNVREDGDAYEAGVFTQDILDNVPHQEDGYVKVNKIL